MDAAHIERTILLGSPRFTLTLDPSTGFSGYDENNLEIVALAREFPDRFEAWPTIAPDDPDYLEKFIALTEQGARGLKLYIGHGYVNPLTKRRLFNICRLNSEHLYPLYARCSEASIPICYHVNCGNAELGLSAELEDVLGRFPLLRVNVPHWMLCLSRPSYISRMLSTFRNLYVDISFGHDEFLRAGMRRISDSTRAVNELLAQFPTRFMFGTDLVVTSSPTKDQTWISARINTYLAMLGQDTYESPLISGVSLNGLALPREILGGVLSDNFSIFSSRAV